MYEQDFEKEYQEFNSAVALFTRVLKFTNKGLVETCEQTLISLLGLEYTINVMNAATFQLAESAPEICQWIWQNFPYAEASISLKEHLIMLALHELISQNLVLGEDFSATTDGTILMNEKAKIVLIESLSHTEWILLEEIIQVKEEVMFY